jgi:hypothetical protein
MKAGASPEVVEVFAADEQQVCARTDRCRSSRPDCGEGSKPRGAAGAAGRSGQKRGSLARSQPKWEEPGRKCGPRTGPSPPRKPRKQAELRGSELLDRTQEVGGSSPPSSIAARPHGYAISRSRMPSWRCASFGTWRARTWPKRPAGASHARRPDVQAALNPGRCDHEAPDRRVQSPRRTGSEPGGLAVERPPDRRLRPDARRRDPRESCPGHRSGTTA